PAFAALAAIHFGRAVEVFALADVEAGKVAAGGERRPNHAIAGDVEAARIDAAFRHLKDLRDAGLGRILAALQADEEAGEGLADAPDIVVYRAGNHAVHAVADQGVELGILGSAGAQGGTAATGRRSAAGVAGIEKIFAAACGNVNVPGLGRIGTAGDLAVAVGVENLAAPAARLLLVVRLVVDLRVDPAEDGAGQLVEVDGFIRVVVELDVVGGEAGVDQGELLSFGIPEGSLAAAGLEREPRGVLVVGIAAPGWIGIGANLGGHPDAALAVDH